MNVFPIELREFRTDSGRIPYRDWLMSLDKETRARVRTRLDRLQLGHVGDAKPIGEGVHELRIHFGPGYRIYFGRHGKVMIILLCGGDKGTQSRDIAKAKGYWSSYLRRTNR